MPQRIRVIDKHPCPICDEPTTNPQVCSRRCSMELARSKSSASKPGPRPHRRTSVEKRFFQYVPENRSDNECWPWYGTTNTQGYPAIWNTEINGQANATRLSWELHKGPIPKGHVVSNSCENRVCTNPKHLVCGLRGVIVGRRLRLNRKTARYGDQNSSTQLSDAELVHVRKLHSERKFKEIRAIAKAKGMNEEYLISVGRGRGRKRKPDFKHYRSKSLP